MNNIFRAWDDSEQRFWYFDLQMVLERQLSYKGSWDLKIAKGKKQQCIGLKDIDGSDIYVGDFLKDEENFIWEVLPLSNGMFKISCDDLIAVESAYPRVVNCKIVGHLFERISKKRPNFKFEG